MQGLYFINTNVKNILLIENENESEGISYQSSPVIDRITGALFTCIRQM